MSEPRLAWHIGNIAAFRADVIVNASNTVLQLGTGVSGAIRRAASPELQTEMHRHAPIPWGGVAVTEPYGLPCSYLFHAAVIDRDRSVGPAVVRACLANVFLRAAEVGAASLALPALGAGAGGLDPAISGEITVPMVRDFLREHPKVRRVTFCFLDEDKAFEFYGLAPRDRGDATHV
jgi:O-acetyl-ADP-ribose deacetylase